MLKCTDAGQGPASAPESPAHLPFNLTILLHQLNAIKWIVFSYRTDTHHTLADSDSESNQCYMPIILLFHGLLKGLFILFKFIKIRL